jgi:hypothetical protein
MTAGQNAAADLRTRLLAYAGSHMDQNERGACLSSGTRGEMILRGMQALAGQPPWLPPDQHGTAFPRLLRYGLRGDTEARAITGGQPWAAPLYEQACRIVADITAADAMAAYRDYLAGLAPGSLNDQATSFGAVLHVRPREPRP